MKTRFLALSMAALIGWSGAIYGQQPGGAPPASCTQQSAYCARGCDSGGIHSQGRCRANCQRRQSDCMTTGMWELPNGQKVPRQRQ